jgi:DNA-binding transcriptional LysR family regulator
MGELCSSNRTKANSMKLRQLEVFHAVMATGSVTEAAKMLHVTQPSVSTVLKHAEDQFGMKLFERLGGRLLATPEAEQLFPEIDRIFSQLEGLKRMTKDVREGRFGFLRLIGNPTLTNSVLPIAVAQFIKKRPDVRVRLQTEISATMISDQVSRREFDLGFVYGPNPDVHTGVETIGYSNVACALPRKHPLAKLSSIRPADLVGVKTITFGIGSPIRTMLEKTFATAHCELDVAVDVSFSAIACVLAQEEVGVALIDPMIFRGEAFPGLVVRPLSGGTPIELQLLFPKNRPRSQISNEFEGVLRGALKTQPSIKNAPTRPSSNAGDNVKAKRLR